MTQKVASLVLTVFLLLVIIGVAAAGNPFRSESSTENGYPTWDSDMINVEAVTETGKGVYVAVLDTGLAPNWRDYFPRERVNTKLGTGFDQPVTFKAHSDDPCGLEVEVGQLHETTWVGSIGSTHGTHVTSTILGYFYDAIADAGAGFDLPPIMVRGIAPNVTVIPVKVLADYQVPALPGCGDGLPAEKVVFGTSEMVAAGINYVTDLAIAGYRPMVINMSLGGPALEDVEQAALDRAIANGVIVVASAGNSGDAGMGYPGAYPPVISVGATGWVKEWLVPGDGPFYRLWWLQSDLVDYEDIPEPTPVEAVYVTDFSSRELPGQELDVLAPGSWVRGPYPGFPGYSHLPWWSKGIGELVGRNPGNFYFVGGTSMSAPHVTSAAALLLEKEPTLLQADIESILKSTALAIPAGSADVFFVGLQTWGDDATGSGLIQVDAALGSMP